MNVRYTIDEDQIVAEALEQEVMLVNLDNGFYYVLEGTGADLWPWVAAGASLPEVTAALAARYSGSAAEIETAVSQFVSQLVDEALLRPAGPDALPPAIDAAPAEARAPFTLPTMYKYTDMANLIQMDPIREVDESGWPRRQASVKKP